MSTPALHPAAAATRSRAAPATSYLRGHLAQLEAEAIYILREVAAQFERPVLLFSGERGILPAPAAGA